LICWEILVAGHPCGVAELAIEQVGSALVGVDEAALDVVVDRRLDGGHEAGTHVDRIGAESERGREARPSAKLPLAMIGRPTWSAAAGISTRPGTSSSPGCPAHSKPSMLNGRDAATLRPQRVPHTDALVDDLDPGRGERRQVRGRVVAGRLDDGDAAIDDRVPELGVGTGSIVGRIVRLTPKGRSVIVRQSARSREPAPPACPGSAR